MVLQPHPPTLREVICQIFLFPHDQSSQLLRGSARVSSNPLNVFLRVPGSLSGLLAVASLFPPLEGSQVGLVGRMLGSALGPQQWKAMTLAEGFHLRVAAGGRRPRGDSEGGGFGGGAGVGGRRGRAAGPIRGGRAPPSSLARLLCSYLDSAARAQEFPVMPPAAPSVAQSRGGRKGVSDSGGGGGSRALP